ncbi:hypothetical protein [Arthrobacter sp. ATA002]|nr:hypothetical protein [Arthrobacter sp. ATA002]
MKDRIHVDVRLDGRDKDEARPALEARGGAALAGELFQQCHCSSSAGIA